MPGGDRTGPWGRGSRTGRGSGLCSGYEGSEYFGGGRGRSFFGRGMGFGKGYGRGRGFRDFFPVDQLPNPGTSPQMSKEDEKDYLNRTLSDLEKDLKAVKSRLKELED